MVLVFVHIRGEAGSGISEDGQQNCGEGSGKNPAPLDPVTAQGDNKVNSLVAFPSLSLSAGLRQEWHFSQGLNKAFGCLAFEHRTFHCICHFQHLLKTIITVKICSGQSPV